MKKTAFLAALLALCLLTGCGDKKAEEPAQEESVKRAVAEMVIKDYGTITMELDGTAAPISVSNFVKLAKDGFYDGLTFHRIMEGFMMQGGDPTGTGDGDSGTNIKGEFAANGVENPITHTRGTVSMARARDFDSASCQFFIVHEDSTFLDGQYAGFGRVTEAWRWWMPSARLPSPQTTTAPSPRRPSR